MRYLNRNEFQKLNKDIDFNDLTVGMQIKLGGTDEPGWYEVVSVRNWMGKSEDFVELELIPFVLDDEEEDEDEELTEDKIWDLIIELEIATDEELELVTGINGYNLDALNDVIYFKTGYHDIEQYLESEGV